MPKLKNTNHELFCHEYIVDRNAKRAYERVYGVKKSAASAENNASRLLRNDRVKQRIDELLEKVVKKVSVTAEDVLLTFLEIRRRCMGDVEEADEEGNITKPYKFDSTGAIKANEALGRHISFFKDKLEVSGNLTIEQLVRKHEGDE